MYTKRKLRNIKKLSKKINIQKCQQQNADILSANVWYFTQIYYTVSISCGAFPPQNPIKSQDEHVIVLIKEELL